MPILYNTLVNIWDKLQSVCSSIYEVSLFRAAFTVAFFGLFRIGELVWTSSVDPNRSLLQSDIRFLTCPGKGQSLHVHLRKSKANQRGPMEIVKIYALKSKVCPVLAMKLYLEVKPSSSKHLFCHKDGSPLTRYQFGAVLTRTIATLNMATSDYKTHSFRIGAATWLAQQGTSYDAIRKLGRWSSNAFLHYIRI